MVDKTDVENGRILNWILKVSYPSFFSSDPNEIWCVGRRDTLSWLHDPRSRPSIVSYGPRRCIAHRRCLPTHQISLGSEEKKFEGHILIFDQVKSREAKSMTNVENTEYPAQQNLDCAVV